LPALPLATIIGCCLPPSLLNTTTPIASKILSGGIVFQFQQEGIANLRSNKLIDDDCVQTPVSTEMLLHVSTGFGNRLIQAKAYQGCNSYGYEDIDFGGVTYGTSTAGPRESEAASNERALRSLKNVDSLKLLSYPHDNQKSQKT
ncbi:hypothetical protein Tco_0710845, partial [Tanacetum coccineum]